MKPSRLPRGAVLLAVSLIAACAPPEADVPITPAGAARPVPALVATSRLEAAMGTAGPAIEALETGQRELDARAGRLRTEAAALAAPVLDPADAARLRALREATGQDG